MSVEAALRELRSGRKILIFDSEQREAETDIVFPAVNVNHRDIAFLRRYAGGLICVAIHPIAADRLGLPYMTKILENAGMLMPQIRSMIERSGDLKYDTRSAFSIWVNHRDVFTGISDRDRALTISKIGDCVAKVMNGQSVDFGAEFRSPGHVPILRAARNLVLERMGQTELSVTLAVMAGIVPAMVMCEMLDGRTGRSLSKKDAMEFARKHGMVFLEGDRILESFSDLNLFL